MSAHLWLSLLVTEYVKNYVHANTRKSLQNMVQVGVGDHCECILDCSQDNVINSLRSLFFHYCG
jgi:hypothetical protein